MESDPNMNSTLMIQLCIQRFTSSFLYHFPPELTAIVNEYLQLTDDNIHAAVQLWFTDQAECKRKYGHISYWDTSKVTNMKQLFLMRGGMTFQVQNRISDFDLPLYWDTSNVTDMGAMFLYCHSFTGKGLEDWDVSKVTDMGAMFGFTHHLQANLSRWNTGAVVKMYKMFECSKFNQPINSWDVRRVRNFANMFCSNEVFNQPLDHWQLDSAEETFQMFHQCKAFKQDLSTWKMQPWYY